MPSPTFSVTVTPCNVSEHRCPRSRREASTRFLIVKLWALGDVLMATPLAAALRQAYPECHITWLIHHDNIQTIDANPYVDEIIVWDTNFWKDLLCERWKKMLHWRRFLGIPWLIHALRARRDLRRLKIDTLISLHPEMLPLLISGTAPKHAIGIFESTPHPHPFFQYERLYTTAYREQDFPAHRTEKYLLPLKALGVDIGADKQMTLGYTAEDAFHVDHLLRDLPTAAHAPLIVLAPMTTWESKNWPLDYYVTFSDAMIRQGCQVVLIGSARETESLAIIAERMTDRPLLSLNNLTFRQAAALIARADVLVSGDTAPMHVAAAVGTPYVALFGPTEAADLAPLSGEGAVLTFPVSCRPCYQMVCPKSGDEYMRCLRKVSVNDVVVAIEKLLSKKIATS